MRHRSPSALHELGRSRVRGREALLLALSELGDASRVDLHRAIIPVDSWDGGLQAQGIGS